MALAAAAVNYRLRTSSSAINGGCRHVPAWQTFATKQSQYASASPAGNRCLLVSTLNVRSFVQMRYHKTPGCQRPRGPPYGRYCANALTFLSSGDIGFWRKRRCAGNRAPDVNQTLQICFDGDTRKRNVYSRGVSSSSIACSQLFETPAHERLTQNSYVCHLQ